MSTSGIEFKDTKNKTFRITGSAWNTLRDKKKLFDTLQYNNLLMTIFTDKQGFQNYFNKNDNVNVDVFGLNIGNKPYIKLSDLNKDDKQRKYQMIIFFSFFYAIFLLIHFYRVLKM